MMPPFRSVSIFATYLEVGVELSQPQLFAKIETDLNGGIIVTTQGFGDATIDGMTVSLVPTGANGVAITAATPLSAWVCGNRAVLNGGTAVTTVPLKILPGSCRGT